MATDNFEVLRRKLYTLSFYIYHMSLRFKEQGILIYTKIIHNLKYSSMAKNYLDTYKIVKKLRSKNIF